jgi:hypothetical protein
MKEKGRMTDNGQQTTDNRQRTEVSAFAGLPPSQCYGAGTRRDKQGSEVQRAEKDEHRTSNVQHRMVNERKRANDGQQTTDNGQRFRVQEIMVNK